MVAVGVDALVGGADRTLERTKRRNGTVFASSGRTRRENSATARTIVPTTKKPSIQR